MRHAETIAAYGSAGHEVKESAGLDKLADARVSCTEYKDGVDYGGDVNRGEREV